MTENIKIYPAAEEDLAGISSLIVELQRELNEDNGPSQETIQNNLRKLYKDSNSYFYLARHKKKIVGFINFSLRRTILHPSPSALIDEMIVSKKYRGKGIGESLVKEVVRKCRDLGCCELEVSTLKNNQKARKFYRKCGFEDQAFLLEMDL